MKEPIMIPFNMGYRKKIESGEYRVVTRDGRPVRIGMWDVNAPTCIVGTYKYHNDDPDDTAESFAGWTSTGECPGKGRENLDLFVIAPEMQLTVFEEACLREFFMLSPQDILPEFLTQNKLKDKCAAMLEAARQEIEGRLPMWRNVSPDAEYPPCLTREMDSNGDWHYCLSSGKVYDGCQYILLAELSFRLGCENPNISRHTACKVSAQG